MIMKKYIFQILIAATIFTRTYSQGLSEDEKIFAEYFANFAGTISTVQSDDGSTDSSYLKAASALKRIIENSPSRDLLKLIYLNLTFNKDTKSALLNFAKTTSAEKGDLVMLALYEYIITEKEFYPEVTALFSKLKGKIPFQISPSYLYFIECWSSLPAKESDASPKAGDTSLLQDKSERNKNIFPDEKEYFRDNYNKGLAWFDTLEIVNDTQFPLSLFMKYEPAIAEELIRLKGKDKWVEPAYANDESELISAYNDYFVPLFAGILDEEYMLKTAASADDGTETYLPIVETVFCFLAENNCNSPLLKAQNDQLTGSIENIHENTFPWLAAYNLKNNPKKLLSVIEGFQRKNPKSLTALEWKKYYFTEVVPDKIKLSEVEKQIEEFTPKEWSYKIAMVRIGAMIDSLRFKAAEDSLLKLKSQLENDFLFLSSDYFDLTEMLRDLYIKTGEYSKSLDIQKQKYGLIKQYFMPGNELRMRNENQLAENYRFLGKFLESREILSELLRVIDSLEIKTGNNFTDALVGMAFTMQQAGESDKYEKIMDSVYTLVVSDLVTDQQQKLKLISQLIDYYNQKGNSTKTEKLLELFEKTSSEGKSGNNFRIIRMKSELAMILFKKGEKEKSGTLLGDLSKLFIELPVVSDNDWMKTFGNLAFLHNNIPYNKGHRNFYKYLKKNSELILQIRDPYFVNALTNIVEFYHREGDFNPAQDFLLAVINKQKQNFSELNPDYLLMTVKLIELMGRRGKGEEFFKLYKELIDVQAKYLRETLPVLTENEREVMMRKFIQVNELCMSVSMKYFEFNLAAYGLYYDNLLRIKGLKLAALKNERQRMRKISDPGKIEKIRKLDDIKNLIGKLYNFTKDERLKTGYDLESLEKEAKNIQNELNNGIMTGDSLIDLSITWQEIRKNLKAGEAALEIFRFRPYEAAPDSVHYLYLIITPETIDHPEIGFQFLGEKMEGEGYQALLDAVRTIDTDYFNENEIKTLKDLYNLFWLPIEYHLQGVKKIYFSADGVYHKINPAVLINPSTGKYVYEEYEIENVISTRELVKRDDNRGKGKGNYLFGYPDLYKFDSTQNKSVTPESDRSVIPTEAGKDIKRYWLSDIPGTKREVEMIDSLVKNSGNESHLFTRVDASETKIKQIRLPEVLHIASHGYFIKDEEVDDEKVYGFDRGIVAQNPLLRSGLFLAGAGVFLDSDPFMWKISENGILTAQECLNLDLASTNLVVLSACETGLGTIQNAEGVYGLQRALMVAGAESVMMSLWRVHDTATMEFMISFYSNWLKTGDKLLSFDKARTEIRNKYKLPYYWGAFVLIR